VQDDRTAEVAFQLAVRGELLELLRDGSVGVRCSVVFGQRQRDCVGLALARRGYFDGYLVHGARWYPSGRRGFYVLLTNRR
jgi:hypothetical protein